MSDDTMSTAASSPALSAQQAPAAGLRHDFASDTELVMAAIARMEAAVRGERAAHERLREDLGSMAEAIAHVKTSLRNAQTTGKPVNVLVLLTWLEARVNGMRGYLGTPPAEAAAPEAVAEPAAAEVAQPESAEATETVPTVSDVVSRLGRASDALEKEVHALEQSAPAADDVPTVSMLGAMVEALTASEPAAADAKAETEAPVQTEAPAIAEHVPVEPEAAVFEVAPEAAMAEAAAAETNVAETAVSEVMEPQAATEAVADDPAPEITAFAAELGTAEPAAPETPAANEVEAVSPEVLVLEEVHIVEEVLAANAVIADEPAAQAVSEAVISESDPISESDSSADVAALVSELAAVETAEVETATVAEATLPEPEEVVSKAPVEETADTAQTDLAQTDSAPAETAPAETLAVAVLAVAETTTAASPAHEPNAQERSVHEFELLTRFAAMEAIPFMQDEIGTAVIFEQKTEFDPAAEQLAFETPAKPVEAAAENEQTAAQPEAVAEEPQPEVVALVQPELEAAESATTDVEPAASIETHTIETPVEAVPQVQPETAIAAQEPPMAAAATKFAAYAATSSMTLGAIGATAAFAGETKPATAGAAETTAPVEAVAPEALTPEAAAEETTPEVEFFEIDEPEAKSEVVAATPDVVSESTLVAEPAPLEVTAAIESAEATAPAAEPEVAKAETAVAEIVEPADNSETASAETEAPIAGPSEAERAAFTQALAEMAVAAALEARTTSVVEAETAAAPATPPAETFDAADDDLSDLFEPEPDAALDPNNILLGPAPISAPSPAFTLDPATAAVLPMHHMALPDSPKPASPQLKLVEMATPEAAKAPAPTRPHDPLAPLKAMSDEEKIALFS